MKFEDVEKAREVYKQKLMKKIWIAIAASVIITLIISASNSGGSLFGFIVTFFGVTMFVSIFSLVIILLSSRSYSQQYRTAYKAYFVEKNLQRIFTDLKYNHNSGLAKEVLSSTQMINTGDVYYSNDLVTGKHKDVAFTQADVHIQEQHTDSDGNTTYTTIFKGRFMIFEFPKKFNFRLEVVEKWFGASRIPGKDKTTGRKFEKIQLESPEFNKIFNTYAEDGFEAFYLLDPAFIHNILELDQQYKGKLFLGFIDNKLIAGLNDNKDAFEPPSVFKQIDEAAETEKIAKEIRLITHFIDNLKLDRKLFK